MIRVGIVDFDISLAIAFNRGGQQTGAIGGAPVETKV